MDYRVKTKPAQLSLFKFDEIPQKDLIKPINTAKIHPSDRYYLKKMSSKLINKYTKNLNKDER